jgi:quinol monooxygenase YgiN
MSVLVLVELNSKPDQLAELRSLVESTLLPGTRAAEGCESATMHENQDGPTLLVFLQRWTSRDDNERYLAWRRERGDLSALTSLLTAPPSFRYFDDVDV